MAQEVSIHRFHNHILGCMRGHVYEYVHINLPDRILPANIKDTMLGKRQNILPSKYFIASRALIGSSGRDCCFLTNYSFRLDPVSSCGVRFIQIPEDRVLSTT